MKAILSPFRLPRPLEIKIEGCDGMVDAWYEEGAITICYEYLDNIWKNVPLEASPDDDVAPIDALVAPLVEVVLHEFGHALFDQLALPVLGREEDAADQVAAYIMLQFGPDQAPRLIRGAAHVFRTQMRQPQPSSMQAFADIHGTPAQRLYNLLCVAYGADRELFRDVLKELPKERAEGCEEEYQQIAYAVRTLIRPHVDLEAKRRVLSEKWLPDIRSRPPCYVGPGTDQPPEDCPPEQWLGPGWETDDQGPLRLPSLKPHPDRHPSRATGMSNAPNHPR